MEQQPGRAKQGKASPSNEHDEKAAIACHGVGSALVPRCGIPAPTVISRTTGYIFPSPARGGGQGGLFADTLPRRAGEGREGAFCRYPPPPRGGGKGGGV